MKTRACFLGLLGAVIVLVCAGTGAASLSMYISVNDNDMGDPNKPIGSILRYDPANNSLVTVGTPVQGKGLSGIDFDSKGKLYGTTWWEPYGSRSADPSQLIKIDPFTGNLVSDSKPTITGSFKFQGKQYDNVGIPIYDLAFHPKTGVLYGISDWIDLGDKPDGKINWTQSGLFTIDTTSGQATHLGWAGTEIASGLAFTPDGKLYMTNKSTSIGPLTDPVFQMYELDPTNADVKQKYKIYYPRQGYTSARLAGLGINPEDGSFFGTWDDDSEIIKGMLGLNEISEWSHYLNAGASASDAAFGAAVPVPAPVLLLGSGLVALALLRRRK